jgi:2',3'-cyclic-nucleotide 2'-phosphodiesterase (5'-nucleotidase family)
MVFNRGASHLLLRCVLSAVCIIGVACSGDNGGNNASDGPPSGKLSIVYSSNIGGQFIKCGCRPPKGGMSRRATIIDSIRNEAENVLVLDSGGLLFEVRDLVEPFVDYARITSHLLSDAMNDIGIDAINVGAYDLANGPDSLRVLAADYPWAVLSANTVWRDTEELVFPTHAVFERGPFTVGVFGIMAETRMGMPMLIATSAATPLDPVAAAKREVEAMSKTTDIIVALANLDLSDAELLIDAVPGIDIMILSHTGMQNPGDSTDLFEPVRHGSTLIIRGPDGGRVLGRMDLDIRDGSMDMLDGDKDFKLLPESVREKKGLNDRSKFYNIFYELGPYVKDRPDMKIRADQFVEWKRLYYERNKVR